MKLIVTEKGEASRHQAKSHELAIIHSLEEARLLETEEQRIMNLLLSTASKNDSGGRSKWRNVSNRNGDVRSTGWEGHPVLLRE